MLKISGLETGYGRVQILRGVDMEVPKGRIVALLGGNGTPLNAASVTFSMATPASD